MSDDPPAAFNTEQRPARVVGRPFQPGQSGNPSGRPAVVKRIREIAQQHGEEAIEGLLDLARDPEQPGAVRRAAWSDILDRGYGKAAQPVDLNDSRPLATVPAQVLMAALEALAAAKRDEDEPDGLSGRGA